MTNEEITIQYLTTEFNNFKARCAELEKENAKLRERLNSVNQTNNYYEEKERYALAEHNENIQLKAQIEKMKNVGNCKHSMNCAKWNEKQTVLGLMKFCLNCKDWELAE